MQIQIVTTSIETKPTAKGSYQQLEVVYKNLTFQGKVESKKIMSFGAGAPSFKTLSDAQAGLVFDIEVIKNAAGYNDWVSATTSVHSNSSSAGVASAASAGISRATNAPKSTYETSEERAQRQILIVRQSSVSSAVAMLTAGAKAPPKLEDVLDTARKLEAFVFGIKDPGPSGFDDMHNFDELAADVM